MRGGERVNDRTRMVQLYVTQDTLRTHLSRQPSGLRERRSTLHRTAYTIHSKSACVREVHSSLVGDLHTHTSRSVRCLTPDGPLSCTYLQHTPSRLIPIVIVVLETHPRVVLVLMPFRARGWRRKVATQQPSRSWRRHTGLYRALRVGSSRVYLHRLVHVAAVRVDF